MYDGRAMETGFEKLKRRMREEPFVPLGCAVTAIVLGGGLRSFVRAADARTQQRFMRARVVAQGGTVIAIAIGSLLALQKRQQSTSSFSSPSSSNENHHD